MKVKFGIFLILLFTAISLIFSGKAPEKKEVVLKSYNNTVALYENGVKKEVFDEIVLNSLPLKDIHDLQKGIIIHSDDELLRILEDFDG